MHPSSRIIPFPAGDESIPSIPVDTPAVKQLKANRQRRDRRRYVKGPILWPTVIRATQAHSKGAAVYLAIKMLADTTRQEEVNLSGRICADLGISREMKRRIVKALAEAGLVAILRQPGRLSLIRLRDPEDVAGGSPPSSVQGSP